MKNFFWNNNGHSTEGFTLTELLVVITITAILSVGVIASYTSSQQKARDSVRETDIQALKYANEQYFTNYSQYPKSSEVRAQLLAHKFIYMIPQDPKSGSADNETRFIYMYGASKDHQTHVIGQYYELSANFENRGNAKSKEGCYVNSCLLSANSFNSDGGNDALRWETGSGLEHVNTNINSDASVVGTNDYGSSPANPADGAAVVLD